MAQSALTVTPPSPTPPTNMSCTGATPPNPPNYTKNTYANPVSSPPPFFDDGTAGALTAFAANTAALASGSGATAGGTEGSYPGAANGVVPASTSVAHEGAGTETVVTAPGSRAECPTQSFSCLGNFTASPNGSHASTLSPTNPATITGLVPASTTSGGGTIALQVNGTNFTKQSVVYVNGVAQTTVFTSSTRLDVAAAPKKATAGTLPVHVVTAGVSATAPTNWTFT